MKISTKISFLNSFYIIAMVSIVAINIMSFNSEMIKNEFLRDNSFAEIEIANMIEKSVLSLQSVVFELSQTETMNQAIVIHDRSQKISEDIIKYLLILHEGGDAEYYLRSNNQLQQTVRYQSDRKQEDIPMVYLEIEMGIDEINMQIDSIISILEKKEMLIEKGLGDRASLLDRQIDRIDMNISPTFTRILEKSNSIYKEALTAEEKTLENLAVENNQSSNSRVILAVIIAMVGLGVGTIIIIQIKKPILKSLDFAQTLSSGDFSTCLDIDQKDEIGELVVALNDMVLRMKRVLRGVKDSSGLVTNASSQISSSAQSISCGTSEQASHMEEISASLEELNSNIQQNSDNSQKSKIMTKKIAIESDEGAVAVRESVNAMKDISEKINVIQEIARNTNLLALNAAIEAARAGEAGKGFAVVASEVSKLAESSGLAAKEITGIASESVKRAEEALEKIEQIVPSMNKSADMSEEISYASQEQVKGAGQINSAIVMFDQVVQQNASEAEELASLAKDLDAQSRSMNDAIGFFQLGIDDREGQDEIEYQPVRHSEISTNQLSSRIDTLDDKSDFSYPREGKWVK